MFLNLKIVLLQGERLKQSIDDLNRNMAKSIAVLEQIEKHSFSNRAKTSQHQLRTFSNQSK